MVNGARGLALRKPTMACMPPMRPKSMPYWNGQSDMSVQAARHFQCCRIVYLSSVTVSAVATTSFFSSAIVGVWGVM